MSLPPPDQHRIDQRDGECRICGLHGRLSYEHVPPKAAFNARSVLVARGSHIFEAEDPERVRMSNQRKGAGAYTLCERCNNETGRLYGSAYVDWAYQGMAFRASMPTSLALPYHIFPSRVAKQILSMFASVCGPGLFQANPQLRKLVLDRDARGLPEALKLYCYMVSNDSTKMRSTGVVVQMTSGIMYSYAETSFAPFGYILTLDSPPPDPGLLDITFFTHHGWKDWRSLHLPVPRRDVNTHYPADFRSSEQWRQALRDGRARREPKV